MIKRTLTLTACLAALTGAMVFALDDKNKDNDKTDKVKEAQRGIEPNTKVTFIAKTSAITGMPVKNAAGEDLGTIHELVIDLGTGHVRYAALSFGGALGVGNKLFAVPWNALTYKYTGDKYNHFLLNVDKEKLKSAPGFDKNQWPDVADPKWGASIDAYYGLPRTAAQPKTGL